VNETSLIVIHVRFGTAAIDNCLEWLFLRQNYFLASARARIVVSDQKPFVSELGIAKRPQKESSSSGWSMIGYGEFNEFQAVE